MSLGTTGCTRIGKRLALIVIVFNIVVIAVFLIASALHDRPEEISCRVFLRSNSDVTARFGTAEFYKISSFTRISGTTSSGMFRFRVQGSKDNGFIDVYWQREGSASPVELKKIVARKPFEEGKVLWEHHS